MNLNVTTNKLTLEAVGDEITLSLTQTVNSLALNAGNNISGHIGELAEFSSNNTLIGNSTVKVDLANIIEKVDTVIKITKEPTGFDNPENVIVTHNANHTITLTGNNWEAYYKGIKIDELINGWVSEAHESINGTFHLYYDGEFKWSNTFPGFDILYIVYVKIRDDAHFGIRECHGFMPSLSHQNAHINIGTYRELGGDVSGLTLLSTVAENRRPDISACRIWDEDLLTINPELTTKRYSQRFLNGLGAPNYNFDTLDIVPLSGNNPYYNSFSSPNFVQTLMPANSMMTVWLFEVPVTADDESQRIRHAFVQGQSITQANNSSPQALTTAYNAELNKSTQELNLGEASAISAEYVCIHKFIIQFTGGNWTIRGSIKIIGSRAIQIGYPASDAAAIVAQAMAQHILDYHT